MPDISFNMPDDQFFALMAKVLAAPTSLPGKSMAGNPQPQSIPAKPPAATVGKPLMLSNKGSGQAAVPPSVAPRTAPISATTAAPKPMSKIAKPPTVVRPAAPATLGNDLGADEQADTELGNEAPEMTGTEASVEADSMDAEATTETANMGDDERVEAEQADLGFEDDESPERPQPAPVRRPPPRPNPSVMGSFRIKGSKDKGVIKPAKGSTVPPNSMDGDGNTLWRCKPSGKCIQITPDEILPPEQDKATGKTNRKRRKPRR